MIDLSHKDGVLTIRLADVAALSRHDLSATASLRDALRSCEERDDVKVVLLLTQADDFCAPIPASEIAIAAARTADPEWYEVCATSSGLYQTLCFCRKVTITAIQGRCTGAGSLLALYSDLTVASRDATFDSPFADMPEANFALAALTMRLNRAKSFVLGGQPLDAEAAWKAGLINRVVPRDRLDEQARALARSIAKVPLDGIAMSKLMVESFLDGQGVGEEFDAAPFHAASLRAVAAAPSAKKRSTADG
jgi:enoyl-CoA hydratase/carnithine racemase